MFGVWEKAPFLRNGPKQFFAEIKTVPRVIFEKCKCKKKIFGIMAWASLVRASDALSISIIPRTVVGGIVASSRQEMARFKNGKSRSGDTDNNRQKPRPPVKGTENQKEKYQSLVLRWLLFIDGLKGGF